MRGSQCRAKCSAHCTNSSVCFVDRGSRAGVCYLYNDNNSKVFMSAFRNLNALTCHNKIKHNDDTNSRL